MPFTNSGQLPPAQPNQSVLNAQQPWANTYKSTSLNGIEFPVEEVEIVWKQRIAQHKKPFVPGAKIESLSREPYMFKIKNALFINGLMSSKGESWNGNQLFPLAFNQVFALLTDPVNPIMEFVHPTLGSVFYVKSVGGQSATNYECKNGQIMSFELIQANREVEDSTAQLDTRAAAYQAATQFDTYYQLPKPAHFTSLLGLYNDILGTINSAVFTVQKLKYKVSFAMGQINKLQATLTAVHNVSTSVLETNLNTVAKSINTIANGTLSAVGVGAGANSFTLGRWIVKSDTTLPQIATYLSNSIEQLTLINPGITNKVNIIAGTKIWYNKTPPIASINTNIPTLTVSNFQPNSPKQ